MSISIETLALARKYADKVFEDATSIEFKLVQTLPSTGVSGGIYLVPNAYSVSNDLYDEYIYVHGAWQKIGSTEVDLSGYRTASEQDIYTGAQIDQAVSNALEPFVVTVTNSIADKSYAEIVAASEAGKEVRLIYRGDVYFLSSVNASAVSFSYLDQSQSSVYFTRIDSSSRFYAVSKSFMLTTSVADNGKGLVVKNGAWTKGFPAPFIVTLTPTAQDFSGTMNKTPQEITAAHESGQEIVFDVSGFPGFNTVYIPAAWCTYATGKTICAACATLVDITHDVQIVIVTSDVADVNAYGTNIYPLTPSVEAITYAQLKAKRDGGTLTPGQLYRITDYVTIINGIYDLSALAGSTAYLCYAISAGHPFDLIVEAISETELSEIAKATHHDGDSYFAGSAVEAWEIKYCLDNDTDRFMWADANGKGVIYGLKDEFNNYCGYDFKNLMFPRYALSALDAEANDMVLAYDANEQPNRYGSLNQIFTALQEYLQTGEYSNPWEKAGYDFTVGGNILGVIQFPAIDATYLSAFAADLYYTFDLFDGSVHSDYSLNSNGKMLCYENEIANTPDALSVFVDLPTIPMGVGCCVFENTSPDEYCAENKLRAGSVLCTAGSGCHGNTLGENCYGVTAGNHCDDNIVGNGCSSNTVGNYCYYNTVGSNCYRNTVGSSCSYNTIGSSCEANTVGHNCSSNTVGNACSFNTVGNGCGFNMVGNYCSSNHVGNYCTTNTVGNHCSGNTVGSYCESNIVGNDCTYNMVGNNCGSNTVGNYCGSNTVGHNCHNNTVGNYCESNTVGEINSNNELFGNTSGCYFGDDIANVTLTGVGDNAILKYYHLCSGLRSVNTIQGTPGRSCETWVGLDSHGVVKEWCPADLVQ